MHHPLAPQETELLTAGFPCVDVSRAGLRRGLEGQSTGLVRHVFRLLQVGAVVCSGLLTCVLRLGRGWQVGLPPPAVARAALPPPSPFHRPQRAKDDRRPVPWVLLENVEALLDRHAGDPPVMQVRE